MFKDKNKRIGKIDDIRIAPNKVASYAIIGAVKSPGADNWPITTQLEQKSLNPFPVKYDNSTSHAIAGSTTTDNDAADPGYATLGLRQCDAANMVESFNWLGIMYARGIGVERDPQKSLTLFLRLRVIAIPRQ